MTTFNHNTTVVDDDVSSISAVHPDVIQTHILSRLDGPTLASASCASSELHALIELSAHRLWKNISTSTWPSTDTPRLQQLISTFPSGHRSFFSDAYSHPQTDNHHDSTSNNNNNKLISAVDIYYKKHQHQHQHEHDVVILSRVHEFESGTTDTTWFRSTPFRVDVLDPKESLPTQIDKFRYKDELEKQLRLSWIVIDPTRKRAANLSSFRPVSVQRHWLSGDVQVRFGRVVGDGCFCGIMVTCVAGEKEKMHVREVSMQVENLEGRILNGEESMVILQGILNNKKKGKKGGGKERYVEWREMKRERVEKKETRERNLDMLCMAFAFAIFIAFVSFLLLLR